MTDNPRHERIRAAVQSVADDPVNKYRDWQVVVADGIIAGLCARLDELSAEMPGDDALVAAHAAWVAGSKRRPSRHASSCWNAGWDAAIAAVEARRAKG